MCELAAGNEFHVCMHTMQQEMRSQIENWTLRNEQGSGPTSIQLVLFALTSFSSVTCTGALETRTFGKRLLYNIKACQNSRADVDRLLGLVQPEMLAKKVLLACMINLCSVALCGCLGALNRLVPTNLAYCCHLMRSS